MSPTSRSKRPEPDFTTGRTTALIRRVSLLVSITIALGLLLWLPFAPERVPVHFNVLGQPDAYGDTWSVLILALVMLGVSVLLTWVSAKPQYMNFPVRFTEDNAQDLYREGERVIVWMSACSSIVFLGIGLAYFVPYASLLSVAGVVLMIVAMIVGLVRIPRAQ
ncbi:DUF1648 domain-containing protein [Humidisolicoccus flavus]|uniref:DUF1648 domain-containing protein n=1 Tax=Humidisolicoccus flavus TaxID=3111414 RepID=UPI0032451693